MKANIFYDSKSNPNSCDEGEYVLVIEETNKCTDAHLCSSRDWAERDFIDMHMDSIIKNDITEIYSLGRLIWKKSEQGHIKMSKIEEMASIAEYNGTSRKEFEDGFIAGANAVLEEIEITLNADRILSHPFPTKEMRLQSIQDKIKELKGE